MPSYLGVVHIGVRAEPKAGYTPPKTDEYASMAASRPGAEDPFELIDYHGLTDVVVWLEPLDGSTRAAGPTSAVVRVGDPKLPGARMHAASTGGRIVIQNAGARPLSVYSVSDGNAFDLGAIATGGEASATARAAGLIEILAEEETEPVAYVYVAPGPWAKIGGARRKIIFDDVPAARYRVGCWHSRLPGSVVELTVSPSEPDWWVDVTLGVKTLPAVP